MDYKIEKISYILHQKYDIKKMEECNTDDEKIRRLQDKYAGIRKRLKELCLAGKISEYIKCMLIDMSNKVLKTIALRYERVTSIVSKNGGQCYRRFWYSYILEKYVLH